MDHGSDRTLLFGVLALRADFLTLDVLISGMNTWARDKRQSLGQTLVAQGALSPQDHELLETLTSRHVQAHGGDPHRSLASVAATVPLLRGMEQVIDTEVHASLTRLADGRAEGDDRAATRPPSPGSPPPPGTRYRILREHARGGLGVVYVARDEELRREVAFKTLQDRYADDPMIRSRFLAEAEITGGLEHPGIVPVYGLGNDDGRPFYAMRLIRGDSLRDAIGRFHRVRHRDPGQRALALRQLLNRFLHVCDAIAFAHSRGVLHRDLKPANIMVGDYGETLVVDWGLARLLDRPAPGAPNGETPPAPPGGDAETLPGSTVGTPQYMSPEQASGQPDRLGPASDVYSLGATLYELLTGRMPFADATGTDDVLRRVRLGDFPPPRRVDPTLAPALEAICLKAMALRPEDRHDSPRALAGELERWLAFEPITAYRDAVTAHEERARAHPERPRYREALARVRTNLGNALHFLGRNEEAVAVHRQAIDEFRALVEQHPHTPAYRERLAVAHSNLGWVLKALDRREEAEAAYAATLDEYKRLTNAHPDCAASGLPGLSGVFLSQGWVYGEDPALQPDAGLDPSPRRGDPRAPSDGAAGVVPDPASLLSALAGGETATGGSDGVDAVVSSAPEDAPGPGNAWRPGHRHWVALAAGLVTLLNLAIAVTGWRERQRRWHPVPMVQGQVVARVTHPSVEGGPTRRATSGEPKTPDPSPGATSEVAGRKPEAPDRPIATAPPAPPKLAVRPETPKAKTEAPTLGLLGALIDPDHDCAARVDTGGITFDVPGSLHVLSPRPGLVNAPRALTEAGGDFEVQVTIPGEGGIRPGIVPLPIPAATTGEKGGRPGTLPLVKFPFTFQGAGLLLWQDGENYVRFERAVKHNLAIGKTTHTVMTEIWKSGALVGANELVTRDTSITLRIQHLGPTLKFFYSPDGGRTWLNVKRLENVFFFNKIGVGISASNVSPRPLSVRFVDFNLASNRRAR